MSKNEYAKLAKRMLEGICVLLKDLDYIIEILTEDEENSKIELLQTDDSNSNRRENG